MHRDQNYSSGKTVFSVGAIALVFLVIGYETALFVHRAASLRIQERRDNPDTVYVISEQFASRLLAEEGYLPAGRSGAAAADCPEGAGGTSSDTHSATEVAPGQAGAARTVEEAAGSAGAAGAAEGDGAARRAGAIIVRRDAGHSREVARERSRGRKVESFRFNPNTASAEELIRLGMSEKQAAAIVSYRAKGGRFARKSDFAKSFVVSDSLYERLEPYIDIPLVDINRADSAAFDALPGIGGYFAAKMVRYREELGGYSCTEQLMEIWKFDREKYDGLKDLICCSPPAHPLQLWSADEETLSRHPHIRNRNTARAIILFRKHTPPQDRSVHALYEAGIIDSLAAVKLARCVTESR